MPRLMTSPFSLFVYLLLSSLLLLVSPTQAQCSSTRTASTTSPTGSTSSSPSSPSPSSTSVTIDVQVGQNGLSFSPSILTASQGSTINFHFDPRNHSVAESRFASPCQYVEGGIWSGYIPTSGGVASSIFSVTLNDSNAHWLYCSQANHCQAGMVMVINPPANSSDTIRAYAAAAQNTSRSTGGDGVSGGLIVANSSSSSPSSSSSSSATSSQSSSSTRATSTSTGLAVANAPNGWLGVIALVMLVVSGL